MSLKDLLQNENKIVTKMGAAFLPNNRVRFREKDLHDDACHMSWLELFVYGITGREYTKEQIEILNFMWTVTSFPEPRIWTNRVAALAGSTRSTATLAISSAIAIAEGTIYGQRPIKRSMDFIIRAKGATDNNINLEKFIDIELSKHKIIYGYSKAYFREIDERVKKMLEILQLHKLIDGNYVKLALDIEKILINKCSTPINYAGLGTAIAADMGFTLNEFCTFITLVFSAGMPPCYIDSSNKVEGCFLPIRCENLKSSKIEKKDWS